MVSLRTALAYTFAAGCAVFLCRALPFLIIRPGKRGDSTAHTTRASRRGRAFQNFLSLVERVIPPVAMTVLACNSIAAPVKEEPRTALPILSAAALSLLAQLWKGNFLLSILGGTALYMILTRLLAA